jgi:mono/diheme cytochrome c family protein
MASAGPAPLDREIVLEGERVFGTQCAHCHGPQGDWPMAARLKDRSRDQFYVLLDRLPTLNPVMPGFEGSDGERRALAEYLVSLKDGATVP